MFERHLAPVSWCNSCAQYEGCEAATAVGLDDPEKYVNVSTVAAMKGDLKTYGAETFRIRKPKQDEGKEAA